MYFGPLVAGDTASETVTFTNNGTVGDPPAQLGTTQLTDANGVYAITSDSCSNVTLNNAASCSVTVEVSPPTGGDFPATLSVVEQRSQETVAVSMDTEGIPRATILTRPTSADFGSVPLGQTGAQTYWVYNTVVSDGDSLNIGQATVSGSGDFTLVPSQDLCSNWTVTPGANCPIEVAYQPTVTGAETATLSIPSNAGNESTATIALSGTGAAATGGPQGPTGTTGTTGATGQIGDPGPVGTTGQTGAAGALGTTGAAGPAGATGSAGAPGPAGKDVLTELISSVNIAAPVLNLSARSPHVTIRFALSKSATVTATLERWAHGHWVTIGEVSTKRARIRLADARCTFRRPLIDGGRVPARAAGA
jgi:hypothetical protein